MSEFDYLGEVKLGSSIIVKPKKKFSSGARLFTMILSASLLVGGVIAASWAAELKNKPTHQVVAVDTPSATPAASPTEDIVGDRANYKISEVSQTKSSTAKKTTTSTKKKPFRSPTPTPSPTDSQTTTTASGSSQQHCQYRSWSGQCLNMGGNGGSGGPVGSGHHLPPTPPRH